MERSPVSGRAGDDRRLPQALGADVRQVEIGDVGEVDDDLGCVGDRGHLVVVQRRVHRHPGGRIDDELLGEGEGHPLEHAALDLARGQQRVDDTADVVDRHDALDADLAGPGVYRNLRDLAAERVYPKAVRVGAARARAVDGGVAELPRYLDHVDV